MSQQCKSHDSSVSHHINCVQSLDSSALLLPTPPWQRVGLGDSIVVLIPYEFVGLVAKDDFGCTACLMLPL